MLMTRSGQHSLTTPCLTTPHFSRHPLTSPTLAYTHSSFPEGVRGLLRAAEAPAAGPDRRHQRPRSLRRTVAGRWVTQPTNLLPTTLPFNTTYISTQFINTPYQPTLSTYPFLRDINHPLNSRPNNHPLNGRVVGRRSRVRVSGLLRDHLQAHPGGHHDHRAGVQSPGAEHLRLGHQRPHHQVTTPHHTTRHDSLQQSHSLMVE